MFDEQMPEDACSTSSPNEHIKRAQVNENPSFKTFRRKFTLNKLTISNNSPYAFKEI